MKNLLCVDVFEGIDYDRLFYMVKEIGFDGHAQRAGGCVDRTRLG